MKKHTVSSLPLLAAGVVVAMRVWAVDIERPKVQTVDTLGVDVATGQVTYSVTPVSIGGASGLSYRLSVYANEANWGGDSGFKTSYSGRGCCRCRRPGRHTTSTR
jgi:hypothetical protein